MTIGMMKVLMAYAPGRSELAFEIRFDSLFGISFCTQNYFDISFVEDINSSSAHSAADDDVDSFISEKIREESGSVARVGESLRACDLLVFDVEEDEFLTMTEMLGHGCIVACYSDSFHFHFVSVLSIVCWCMFVFSEF